MMKKEEKAEKLEEEFVTLRDKIVNLSKSIDETKNSHHP
jgi:hypothetical protein